MRNLLLVTLAAACLLCGMQTEAEARLFGRRRGGSTPVSNCPGGICPNPAVGGQLSINANGGFVGQLPDSYYQQHASVAAAPTAPVVSQPTPKVTVSINRNATLAQAEQRLAKAQEELERAQATLREAMREETFQAQTKAVQLEAEIRIAQLTKQREIEDMQQQLLSLQAVSAKLASPEQK